jgi:hypothetical protein
MDNLVNSQIDALASQADGAAILAEVEASLAARPAVLSPAQQASLDRANLMLGRRAGIVARPAPARFCIPGNVRDVTVQPIFFRVDAADAAPTGGSFAGRMQETRDVWGKVGVQFNVNAAITLDDAARKVQGGDDAERNAIISARREAGIEVFVVDNDVLDGGGAATISPGVRGPGSQIVLSDRGTSGTLLAHEMGHVLGLRHPRTGTPHDGDAGTIMEPSDSHSVENPRRNTLVNATRLTWAPGAPACIRPDP